MSHAQTMRAVRLHGAGDVRVEQVGAPRAPGPGEVLLRVGFVGICGSDLHVYLKGRIGSTRVDGPHVLGHEFGGTVEAVGENALDGNGRRLPKHARVAVDPAVPCRTCESCVAGHPNLCPHHTFVGLYPTPGALCERLLVPAWVCFPVPAEIPDEQVPLLETLGVALHAVDLAHVRVASSVAIIGAGAVGLLVAQVARLAGARPVFVTDRLPWRLQLAQRSGGEPVDVDASDPVRTIMNATRNRGVDVALECAWSTDESVAQAVDVLRPGGRLVIVGIPDEDRLTLVHSTARRKGLTIAMSRRMKHTYPRAIALAECKEVDLDSLISHRFPLSAAADAIRCAAHYDAGVLKVVVGADNWGRDKFQFLPSP
jgi:L-iditol 2-dehydrogenase